MSKALGLIEVIGLTQAIVAADAAVKSASVNILGIEKVTGGIVTVKIIGDVSAVTAAVESSKSMIEHSGNLRSAHVISRLHEDVFSIVEEINTNNRIFKDQLDINKKESNGVDNVETQGLEVETLIVQSDIKIENIKENLKIEEIQVENLDIEIEKVQEIDEIKNLEVIDEKEGKEDLVVSSIKKEEANTENKFNREELLKMTVKELRRLALTLKPAKTSSKIKYLKKEELIELLLKLSKEEGRN
ncbi:BMC domain-containing protein [Clostridium sardiniense]|uniref:BMC domain-containing protein n=1 Tax=Clostridium sardiniense TaxID=29369 RepID=A0ABS7KTZ2_CLOSR|nr:BMC domain-containing protein [Clostridium sardiniense]MBY0754283.1 BMC domain-containing protein [Clostridium sardiniense]MDQ0461015.1 microcompartment protein CcmL/EutN [Clostridium sardiniense]